MSAQGTNQFYAALCVILGGIAGFLIAFPLLLAGNNFNPTNFALTILCAILGTLAGYRRRHSRAFFYLTVVTVLVLTTTITKSMFG